MTIATLVKRIFTHDSVDYATDEYRKYVCNEHERNLANAPVVFSLRKIKPGEYFRLACRFYHDGQTTLRDAVMIALQFYDANGAKIPLQDTQGFSLSYVLGYYRYFNSSSTPFPAFLMFRVPVNCKKVKIVVRQRKHNKAPIYLAAGGYVKKMPDFGDSRLPILLNEFSTFLLREKTTLQDARAYVADLAEKHRTDPLLFAQAIFSQYRDSFPKIAVYFGMIQFEIQPDPQLAERIYRTCERAGVVSDKYMFVNQLPTQHFRRFSDARVKKAEEERLYLQKGFPLATMRRKPPYYTPERVVAYVGDGRLPDILPKKPSDGFAFLSLAYPSARLSRTIADAPGAVATVRLTHDPKTALPRDMMMRYVDKLANEIGNNCITHKCAAIHVTSRFVDAFAAVRAANILGVRSVYEITDAKRLILPTASPFNDKRSEYERMTAALELQAAKAADYLAVRCDEDLDILRSRGFEQKSFLLPTCPDAKHFSPRPRNVELSARHKLTNVAVIGCVAATLRQDKPDNIFRIVSHMTKTLGDAFALTVIGSQSERHAVTQTAKALRIEPFVRFIPEATYDNAPEYLSCIDVMYYPERRVCTDASRRYCISPEEAKLTATPVVCGDDRTLADGLCDTEQGRIATLKTSVIGRLLENILTDDSLRTTLGNAARDKILKEIHPKTVAQHRAEMYKIAYESI